MPAKVSDAEMEVLRVVADLGEAGTGEIYERCARIKSWAPGTVITFLRRLEAKGYLEHFVREGSKAFVYRPTSTAHSLDRRLVKDLLDRVFGGNPLPMVSYLLEEQPLEKSQIDELRQLIEDHSRKGGKGR
jgi:predicted transcriptional regulator